GALQLAGFLGGASQCSRDPYTACPPRLGWVKPRRGVALRGKKRATRRRRTALKPTPGSVRAAQLSHEICTWASGDRKGSNRCLSYHRSVSAFQPAVLGQYLVFQLTILRRSRRRATSLLTQACLSRNLGVRRTCLIQ